MKKCTVVFMVICLFPIMVSAQVELKIATEEWPPYVYNENGHIIGYSVEILDAVFSEMDIRYTMTQYPWKRAMKMVFSGQEDALFHASQKADRMEYCYYPTEDLCRVRYVFFIRKEDAGHLKFESLNDLKGYTIGVTQGYSYTEEFLKFLYEEHRHFEENPSDESNLKMLAKRRIDYFPAEERNGVFLLKKLGKQDEITSIGAPALLEKSYFIIFNKKNVDMSFVEKFSETLAKFKQTERFKEIEMKYIQ